MIWRSDHYVSLESHPLRRIREMVDGGRPCGPVALFGEEVKTDTSWKLVTEHFRKGLILHDPEAIRFMAGFQSVAAEQPLGEFDAERALVMPSIIEGIRRAREYRKLHPPDAPLERLDRALQRLRAGLSPWG